MEKKNVVRPPFSQRNGYTKPSGILIINDVPEEVSNAISSALYRGMQRMETEEILMVGDVKSSVRLSQHIWSHFWHKSIASLNYSWVQFIRIVTDWLKDPSTQWYHKLDFVEFIIDYLNNDNTIRKQFINELNTQFEVLSFGYRIVEGMIVDIISQNEINSIETAIEDSIDLVGNHLQNAIALHTKRPDADYSNSIKESISAVEAQLRHMTGENTLGEALKALAKSKFKIHPILKLSIEKAYAYTNQPDTGIRHSLMDTTSNYTPSSPESLYMLVTCSAFVNYLRNKR